METKICKECGRELPLSEFYKKKTCKDGHMNVCKECFKQQQKQYKQEHKEAILEQKKKYRHEHKEEIAEYNKQYRHEHKEEKAEYNKQYFKQYNKTQMGRAVHLVCGYRQSDKNANRGECTLTAKWIVDNIFTSKCHWCGETDWNKLGCDRIDNDKPHTPDNVNPCCEDCNNKRGTKTYEEFLELIKTPVTYV